MLSATHLPTFELAGKLRKDALGPPGRKEAAGRMRGAPRQETSTGQDNGFVVLQSEKTAEILIMKHVLITGVSTGIGFAAAQAFVARGYRVFGSVRRQEDAEKLPPQLGPNFVPLVFDVTDHAAIAEAARNVEAAIGKVGLTGLINNAGFSTLGLDTPENFAGSRAGSTNG
jgi:hypothetical protein